MSRQPAAISAFGQQLRRWRCRRGLSQLQLAVQAGTTSRHVSFVETGRSRPGREWILRVAECLRIPLADRNALLRAAGLAPAYGERDLEDVDMRPIAESVRGVIDGHSPFPAAAMDATDRLLLANAAYRSLFPGWADLGPAEALDRFYGEWGPDRVENWSEVGWALAERSRNLAQEVPDPVLVERSERIAELVADVPRPDVDPSGGSPTVQARIRLEGESISLFFAAMRFEHVRDVTASRLRVELGFPADEASSRYFVKRFARSPD